MYNLNQLLPSTAQSTFILLSNLLPAFRFLILFLLDQMDETEGFFSMCVLSAFFLFPLTVIAM